MRRMPIIAASLILLTFCSGRREGDAAAVLKPQAPSHGMEIVSSAFATNGAIPPLYGCAGKSISPPLSFNDVPQAARSLALLVEDPDAPGGLFTHWVVWNIPPTTSSVAEGHPPAGGVEGTSSYGRSGWGPPCPPKSEHRYVFTLYALNSPLQLPPSAGREQLQAAMKGHIVAEAKLVGWYGR